MNELTSPNRSGKEEVLRVLFIEDNPNDLELSLRVLRQDGFTVVCDVVKVAEDLERCLQRCEYDVLISDFYLGGWDGLAAFKQVVKRGVDVPFILVTGTLGEEKAVECLQAGVDDFLLKDRLSRLPAAVRKAILDKARARQHREAEERLRRSEEYFRSLIENVTDIISIVDEKGVLRYLSPSVNNLLGFLPEELIGRRAHSLVHPDDQPRLQALLGESFQRPRSGKAHQFRFHHRDGSWRFIESKASNPRPGSDLTGMIITSRDVTDQLMAAGELRDSEERFRATFEHAAVGMAHVALDGRWLRVNRKLCDIVGYTNDELLKKNSQEITHPDDLAADAEKTHGILIGDLGTYVREKRYIRKNGTVAWVKVTVSLVGTSTGAPKYFIDVIEDITERRKAQEAVLESEARFRQLAENIQEVFWLANPDKSVMIYASPAFEKIWGHRCEALYARPQLWLETVHPDDRERLSRAASGRRVGEAYDEEYRVLRTDGVVSWIRDRAFPISDSQGMVYRLAGIAEDITRNKQLEAQFLQSQKMESVGRLAGGVAHDFNNMLTAIGSFARLAMETLPPDSQAHSDLTQVLKATDRAVGVTRQLLTFARQQIFQPVIVDPNKVIANLEKMLSRLVREDIELVFRSGADVGTVKADPGQLDQVIINLVVNATDAMPNGGKLTIETGIAYLSKSDIQPPFEATSGKYVMLSVSDTGVGMSEENQARLFEPFFTTKPVGKGTGLGLATVYGIVTQSGGHVKVSSRLGEGTTFRIYLPSMNDEVAAPGDEAELGRGQRGTETILLVEDQDDVRKLVLQILEIAGYSVLEAQHGEEALEIARRDPAKKIDLLLSDVVMPKMGGRALAEMLQKDRPSVRVLYMSGYVDHNFSQDGMLEEDTSFLHKPFVPSALLAKIREVLDGNVGRKA